MQNHLYKRHFDKTDKKYTEYECLWRIWCQFSISVGTVLRPSGQLVHTSGRGCRQLLGTSAQAVIGGWAQYHHGLSATKLRKKIHWSSYIHWLEVLAPTLETEFNTALFYILFHKFVIYIICNHRTIIKPVTLRTHPILYIHFNRCQKTAPNITNNQCHIISHQTPFHQQIIHIYVNVCTLIINSVLMWEMLSRVSHLSWQTITQTKTPHFILHNGFMYVLHCIFWDYP